MLSSKILSVLLLLTMSTATSGANQDSERTTAKSAVTTQETNPASHSQSNHTPPRGQEEQQVEEEEDTNVTITLPNGQTITIPRPTENFDGDCLAYPPEGGVLVLEGWRVKGMMDKFEGVDMEDDEVAVRKFREVGATYYARVADYSAEINEDGSSKME